MQIKLYKGVNMNKNQVLVTLMLIMCNTYIFGQGFIDIETGAVFSGYNDVQIPRRTGTQISLSKELKTDPAQFFRLRLSYTVNKKHIISALYAPLRLHGSGEVNRPVTFEGITFPSNTLLKSTYMFNSYRIAYRYDFIQNNRINFGLGFTAKIRDAAITLESADTISKKPNVGFVPIINFNFEWMFANRLSFLLNGDALGAPQGRAEDVMAAIQYKSDKDLNLRFGYRFLEGGANVEQVNNFTWINYILIGITHNF
jgi:hypothetical protein